MESKLTLDWSPEDPDDRLNEAIQVYFAAAEAGSFDPASWLSRQPADIQELLGDFVRGQMLLNPARPQSSATNRRSVPLTLPDFQRYTQIELLGKGGMGVVYRAKDRVLNRSVAMKVIHNDMLSEETHRERFYREARLLAQLQHRNITPIYDYGTIPAPDGRPYFTMQLIASTATDSRFGNTLQQKIRQHFNNPTADGFHDLLLAFIGVCDAVAYAHTLNILHRDLKPANVMMATERDVVVLDWGLGKQLVENVQGRPSTRGGTPEYLAPEHARGIEVGKPTDVFGLGGILTAILTGAPVFQAETAASSIMMAASGDTRGAMDRLEQCQQPKLMIDLAVRCLSLEPADRPTAFETQTTVVQYLASLEERVRRSESEAAAASQLVLLEKSRRRVQGLMALVILILLLIVVILLSVTK